MIFKVYDSLPEEAKAVRITVFVDEQGFTDEFDATDNDSTHIIGFDESGRPATTCRIIKCGESVYMFGRIAVLKEYRGKGYGAATVRRAEEIIAERGGGTVIIHSQLQAKGFYEAIGYVPTGETDVEQGCPHLMLTKEITAKH